MYGKLFASIFDGSLYGNFEGTVVMMALIALQDAAGCVDMTPEKLAAATAFPLEVVLKGLQFLSQPDRRSRSKEEQGRRIVLMDPEREWGWRLVNAAKYRSIRSAEERREYMREYMRVRRLQSSKSTGSKQQLAKLAQVEVEVEVKKNRHNGAMSTSDLVAEGISEQSAVAWFEVRRSKRAKPPSQLAWTSFKNEAIKAGWNLEDAVRKCIARNWITFDADFVHDRGPASRRPRTDEI